MLSEHRTGLKAVPLVGDPGRICKCGTSIACWKSHFNLLMHIDCFDAVDAPVEVFFCVDWRLAAHSAPPLEIEQCMAHDGHSRWCCKDPATESDCALCQIWQRGSMVKMKVSANVKGSSPTHLERVSAQLRRFLAFVTIL